MSGRGPQRASRDVLLSSLSAAAKTPAPPAKQGCSYAVQVLWERLRAANLLQSWGLAKHVAGVEDVSKNGCGATGVKAGKRGKAGTAGECEQVSHCCVLLCKQCFCNLGYLGPPTCSIADRMCGLQGFCC